jgi:hypothetical protein
MTQVARGLDPDGLLLLDVVVNGVVPESLADADLQVQVGPCGGVGERGGVSCSTIPKQSGPRSFLTPQPRGSGHALNLDLGDSRLS